jgi:hypothetical protein
MAPSLQGAGSSAPVSGNHLYAGLGADVETETAAVAFVGIDHESFPTQPPCSEIAYLHTETTVGAGIQVGLLDHPALVAAIAARVDEVTTAIITAEADSVGLIRVGLIPERPGNEMFVPSLIQDSLNILKTGLLKSRGTRGSYHPKLKADVHA